MRRLYLNLGRIVSLGALLEWRMAGVWMKLLRSFDPSHTRGKTFRQSWNGSSEAAQAIGGEVESFARPVLALAMSAWRDRGKLIHGNWLPGELLGHEVGTYFLMNPRRSGVAIDSLTYEEVQQIIAKLDDAVSKVVWLDESLRLVEVDD